MADETQYNNLNLDEIVFENRNREYGAYDLRSAYAKILTKSFLIGTAIFLVMALTPFIYLKIQQMNAKAKQEVDAKLINVLDEEKIIEEVEKLPPPPPPPPKEEPKVEIIQNVVPEPKRAPKVETPPPPISQQLNTQTGLTPQAGVQNPAYTPPPQPASTGKVVAVAVKPQVDDKKVYSEVEQLAEFPGGIKAFRSKVESTFDQGEMDGEEGTMKAEVTFVVEKDGQISDVKATGANKYFNQEAERTVKSIKNKWSPAKINGQSVRYRFRMPIAMQF